MPRQLVHPQILSMYWICGASAVFWIGQMVGTCLCMTTGTSTTLLRVHLLHLHVRPHHLHHGHLSLLYDCNVHRSAGTGPGSLCHLDRGGVAQTSGSWTTEASGLQIFTCLTVAWTAYVARQQPRQNHDQCEVDRGKSEHQCRTRLCTSGYHGVPRRTRLRQEEVKSAVCACGIATSASAGGLVRSSPPLCATGGEALGQRFTGPEDARGRCWTVAWVS